MIELIKNIFKFIKKWIWWLFFVPPRPHLVNLESEWGHPRGKSETVCKYLLWLDSDFERRSYLFDQLEYAYMKGNEAAMGIGLGGASEMDQTLKSRGEESRLYWEALEHTEKLEKVPSSFNMRT